MLTFIREAGYPIYFVLTFGAASLAAAVNYQKTLRRDALHMLIGLAIATMVVGALGTIVGVQKSAAAIGEVDNHLKWIFLLGLKEALNNLSAALAFVGIDVLVATSGALRFASVAPVR